MHREKSFDKNKKLITEILKKNPYLLINILEKYYPINFSLFIKLEKNKIISLSTIQNNNNIIWCNNFNNKYIEESYKENEFNLESFYSFKVKPKFKLNDLKENFEKYDWKPIKEVLFDFDNNQEITDEIYKFYYLSNVENRFDLPIQKIFNNSATWQEYF
uniref:hypothetical protein n=1 Tax=Flavobacterium sp. TaxID=239 RepID=UPI0025BC21A5